MEVRAKLFLRNNKMIAARENLSLSQFALSKEAGVPFTLVQRLEKFDYHRKFPEESVVKLATFLGITTDDIFPEELLGIRVQSKYMKAAEVPTKALLHAAQGLQDRFLLPSPAEEAENKDMIEVLKKHFKHLTYREREVMNLLYGLNNNGFDYNLSDVGRIFKVSSQRISTIKAKAIRKLRECIEKKGDRK